MNNVVTKTDVKRINLNRSVNVKLCKFDSIYSCLLQIFINNEYVNSESGKTFPTINPATGEKITDLQEGDKVCTDYRDFNLLNR